MGSTNPFELLQQMAGGYCVARSLHVVAELGVADALDEESHTAADLAATVGAHPDALARVMRLLAAHGVFETGNGTFRHSPASRLLRADHPQSMRAFARMFGLHVNWRAYDALDHSVRTGLPATEKVLAGTFWEYFAAHPKESAIFNAAMAAKSAGQVPAIVAAYDFSRLRTVADIGGGRGHLLQAILDANPAVTGVLFDQPHVIQEVTTLASARLTLQAGDFFTDPLPACDAYVLMEIIHDWNDEQSTAIISAVRRVAPAGAKLLLVETIVPDAPGPDWSQMLDVHMMTFVGGKQRTTQEYSRLFEAAGFVYVREVDTGAGISVLEAVPAESTR